VPFSFLHVFLSGFLVCIYAMLAIYHTPDDIHDCFFHLLEPDTPICFIKHDSIPLLKCYLGPSLRAITLCRFLITHGMASVLVNRLILYSSCSEVSLYSSKRALEEFKLECADWHMNNAISKRICKP